MKECPSCGRCYDDDAKRCSQDGGRLSEAMPGSRLIGGRYRLERRIGRGGMGAVYHAFHVGLERSFALKMVLQLRVHEEALVERFRREAKALGRLDHPNVVRVTDYGVDEDGREIPYLVMELLEGETLSRRIDRTQGLSPEEALPVIGGIAAGLDYAHSQGILHRDLKPSNVFLTGPPEQTPTARIVDFGLARVLGPLVGDSGPGSPPESTATTWPFPSVDTTPVRPRVSASEPGDHPSSGSQLPTHPRAAADDPTDFGYRPEAGPRLTEKGVVFGTPGYMAPEMLDGHDATRHSDLYALGVLTYKTLTGRMPFEADTLPALLVQQLSQPAPPSQLDPAIDERLDDTVLSALAKDPEQRPPSATAFFAKLRASYSSARVAAWRRRQALPRLLLAAVLGLVVAGAAFAIQGGRPLGLLDLPVVDALFRWAPLHPPDPRVSLVVIDDASFEGTESLAQRGDEIGHRLLEILVGGAAGVAFDLTPHPSWASSQPFTDLLLHHSDRLVLSVLSENGETVGTDVVAGLVTVALGADRAGRLFGHPYVTPDADGRVRRLGAGPGPLHLAAPSFSLRAARLLQPETEPATTDQRIDFSADWRLWDRVSWSELPALLASEPRRFAGQLVIVGGEWVGSGDVHRVPAIRGLAEERLPGYLLQGLMVDSLLAEDPIRSVGRGTWVAVLAATVLLLFLCLFLPRPLLIIAGGVLTVALGTLVSVTLFYVEGRVVPILLPWIVLIVTAAIGLIVRRRLTPHPEMIRSETP